MTNMEIILLIVSLAFFVIAGYAVWALIQIRKTSLSVAKTLDSVNQSLPVIMKNLEEITTRMNKVTNTVERRVDDFSSTFEKINGAMSFYLGKEQLFRQQVGIPVANVFRTYGAVVKGISVFLDYLKTGLPSGNPNRHR
ncbi:MAG: DUF948 domain-containing protein [Syntrophobacterales bacterium]|nr:DUF948 domain-containing protein [Syntrophobacterales bacterium]